MNKKETMQEEPYEVRRRREILGSIKRLEAEMSRLNLILSLFRQKNFVTINGRLVWKLDAIAARAEKEAEWHRLEIERDELLNQWRKILSEHAAMVP